MDTVISYLFQIFVVVFACKLTLGLLRKVMNVSRSRLNTDYTRRLGRFEEMMELSRNERESSTNTCYVMTLHSKETLKESLVRNALVLLAKRQPMLRAVVKTVSINSALFCPGFWQEEERYFEIIEPSKVGDLIDLIVSGLPVSQWQDGWYELATSPFTNLLWRTVLLKEEYHSDSDKYLNTIIFQASHCIVDGVSGMKMCRTFLSHLNKLSENPRAVSEDVPSLPLLPSFHEIINGSRRRSFWQYLQESFALRPIFKFIIRLKWHIKLAYAPVKPYELLMPEPSLNPGGLMYRVFSESETSQIRRACRANGVTVTAALVAAAHISFCKVLEAFEGRNSEKVSKSEKLTHGLAINGTRVCRPKPPDEYLGNFLLSEKLTMPYEISSDNFWSLAKKTTDQIQTIVKNVSTESERDIFTPKEVLDEFASPLDSKKKLQLFGGNYVSSVGGFDFDDDSGHKAFNLDTCFYYSIPFGFNSFSSQFNGTINGKMTWVIVCSNFVPQDVGKQFERFCFETLLTTASQ